jgi:hypothetical protein
VAEPYKLLDMTVSKYMHYTYISNAGTYKLWFTESVIPKSLSLKSLAFREFDQKVIASKIK